MVKEGETLKKGAVAGRGSVPSRPPPIEWNPGGWERTFGKFSDLPHKLPDPAPGTHFGEAGEHYGGYGSHHNESAEPWVISRRHGQAAREHLAYQRGYANGFSDCFKRHVRIG